MSTIRFITADEVNRVHDRILKDVGGMPGLRSVELLESSLGRAQNKHSFGGEISIPALAASYCYSIARNHSYFDKNKSTAICVSEMFLKLNGHSLSASDQDIYSTVVGVAAGNISENTLSQWYGQHSKQHEKTIGAIPKTYNLDMSRSFSAIKLGCMYEQRSNLMQLLAERTQGYTR
jgi:death on curing protein